MKDVGSHGNAFPGNSSLGHPYLSICRLGAASLLSPLPAVMLVEHLVNSVHVRISLICLPPLRAFFQSRISWEGVTQRSRGKEGELWEEGREGEGGEGWQTWLKVVSAPRLEIGATSEM